MTPIEVEIRNQIVTLSELGQSQVGFGTVPTGTGLPYIAIAKISADRGYTHDGFDDTASSLIQANIYAESYQQAKQLGQKLYQLHHYASSNVRMVQVVAEVDGFDNAVNRHSTGLDFMITHYEN